MYPQALLSLKDRVIYIANCQTQASIKSLYEGVSDQPSSCFSCHITIDVDVDVVNVHRVHTAVHLSSGQYVRAVTSHLKRRYTATCE